MFWKILAGIILLGVASAVLMSDKPEVKETEIKNLEVKTEVEQAATTTDIKNNVNNMNSELKIETLVEGNGTGAENGKTVFVHYTGKFENGTVFDSSVTRGTPFDFVLGSGMVIKGWDQGVLGMKVGEKRLLTIPSDLAYGPRGVNVGGQEIIPGGATLIFEVELLDVK